MGTNQDHTWQILDDILVFLAGRHVPTPERTYKLDGGWQLAKGDLQRYVIGIEAAIAKAISDRQDSDRKVMEADEALNRTKLQLAAAEKQRDDAQRIAKKADDGFGEAIKDWRDALATIDMLRGSNATLAADVESAGRDLAEERARLDYMIDESNDGNGWISDDVWDDSPTGDDEDPKVYIRRHIDECRKASA